MSGDFQDFDSDQVSWFFLFELGITAFSAYAFFNCVFLSYPNGIRKTAQDAKVPLPYRKPSKKLQKNHTGENTSFQEIWCSDSMGQNQKKNIFNLEPQNQRTQCPTGHETNPQAKLLYEASYTNEFFPHRSKHQNTSHDSTWKRASPKLFVCLHSLNIFSIRCFWIKT